MAFFDETDGMSKGVAKIGTPKEKSPLVIQFYHVATIKKASIEKIDNGSQASFKAFLTTFKDNFKVNWNIKETFGRMDAIQSFKNTQRSINIAFDVPSHSEEEAIINFNELKKLISMQYPVYEKISNIYTENNKINEALDTVLKSETELIEEGTPPELVQQQIDSTINFLASQKTLDELTRQAKSVASGRFISAPPLLYVKFANWINNENGSSDSTGFNNCLVGTINDISFEPDLEQGMHIIEGNIIPKLFLVNLNITVIHTQELGWINTGKVHIFGDPKNDPSNSGVNKKVFSDFPYHFNEE